MQRYIGLDAHATRCSFGVVNDKDKEDTPYKTSDRLNASVTFYPDLNVYIKPITATLRNWGTVYPDG